MRLPLQAVNHAMKKDCLDYLVLKTYSAPVQPASVAPDTTDSRKANLSDGDKPSKIEPTYKK